LPVLAGERVHNEKSASARRLALSLGNLDPKKTPEVIALGGAFLQQAVNSPKNRKRRTAMSLPPRPSRRLRYLHAAVERQQCTGGTHKQCSGCAV
jgi:hypothetical protein